MKRWMAAPDPPTMNWVIWSEVRERFRALGTRMCRVERV